MAASSTAVGASALALPEPIRGRPEAIAAVTLAVAFAAGRVAGRTYDHAGSPTPAGALPAASRRRA